MISSILAAIGIIILAWVLMSDNTEDGKDAMKVEGKRIWK